MKTFQTIVPTAERRLPTEPSPEASPDRSAASPVAAVRHVTKRFGSVVAVDDLSFDLAAGEIVALLGENGAGKSTIIGVLAGLFGQEYEGELTVRGEPYRPAGVAHAERMGIVQIAQEISVVPELTVAQNLFLNREPTRWRIVDHLAMRRAAASVLDEFGIDVDASSPIGALDLARQQLVMIARALHEDAHILILDEPTAALTADEAARLFERLRAYRRRGTTSLFVSHRLAEVFALADRILVLRDGRLAGDHVAASTDRAQVVLDMLGESATSDAEARVPPVLGGQRLRVRNLTVTPAAGGRALVDDVSLEVAAGEIVGLFGLVGSGAGVVGEAVFGAWSGSVDGEIAVDGRPVSIATPGDAIACGIGLVTQDRRDALVAVHSVAENVAMASLGRFRRGPFLDRAAIRTETKRRIEQLSIRVPSELSAVATLSGGNQQKVQVARWLVADTPILVLDDPTRGVDVGARAEIHAILRNLACAGAALLLASSDASELIAVCTRIIVIRDGRVAGEVVAAGSTDSELIEIAAGLVGSAPKETPT